MLPTGATFMQYWGKYEVWGTAHMTFLVQREGQQTRIIDSRELTPLGPKG